MTCKFTVHTGDPTKRHEGIMEDMGLCFVSKFTIDGQDYFSFIAKDLGDLPNGCDLRMAEDVALLESYGYYDLDPQP